jgi:3-phenylpropionate/trans-cinnamate dioxygenase ferredoxin reductase component
MAGALEVYGHLPFFYSDLFDLGYEAVGTIDSRLDVVEDWVQKFHKGVVYYLKERRVQGVLLWNTWGLVDGGTVIDRVATRTATGQAHRPRLPHVKCAVSWSHSLRSIIDAAGL